MGDLVDSGVAEIRTGPFGTQLRASDYVEAGRPVLNVRNVGFGDVRADKLEHVDEATADRLSRHILQRNDIVFGRKGAVERHAFITDDFVGALQGSDCIRLRLSASAPVRAHFVSFALRTAEHQAWMQAFCSHGATMASLNQDILRQIRLPDLPLTAQDAVIDVLGAIDDLIENNRRRAAVLEEMARAIYREWFFRVRYPGYEDVSLVDSLFGPIPEGWKVESLYDVADVGFGFSFKSKRFADSGAYPVVRIRDVPKGTTSTFSDEEPGERYRVVDGDVLIGMDGEFHLRQWSGGVAWLNQRVARLRPRSGLSALHLMLAVEAPIREWNAAIVGTTVAHLGKRHLEQVQVVIPEEPLLERATALFDDVSQEMIDLLQTSRRLADVRDLVLPKLVTGLVDVAHLDLDALTEAATA